MRYNITSSFLKGYKKALDLSGTKNWPDISGGTAKDFDALRRDWYHVEEAIRRSADQSSASTGKRG